MLPPDGRPLHQNAVAAGLSNAKTLCPGHGLDIAKYRNRNFCPGATIGSFGLSTSAATSSTTEASSSLTHHRQHTPRERSVILEECGLLS